MSSRESWPLWLRYERSPLEDELRPFLWDFNTCEGGLGTSQWDRFLVGPLALASANLNVEEFDRAFLWRFAI